MVVTMLPPTMPEGFVILVEGVVEGWVSVSEVLQAKAHIWFAGSGDGDA